MEDPDPILATPLECVPVLEPVTRIPVVASDEEKATPRASVVLDLLGELANMNQVLSPKNVRDRVNPTRAERNLMEHTGALWNGRQVRNAFRRALALGHHERVCMLRNEGVTVAQAAVRVKKEWMRVRLTRANFEKIAETSSEFEEHVDGLRGRDNDNVHESEVMQLKQQQQQIHMARKDYGGGSKQGKAKQLPGDPINHETDKGGQQSSIRGGSACAKGNKGKGKAVDYGFDDEDEDEEGIHDYYDEDEEIETDN